MDIKEYRNRCGVDKSNNYMKFIATIIELLAKNKVIRDLTYQEYVNLLYLGLPRALPQSITTLKED